MGQAISTQLRARQQNQPQDPLQSRIDLLQEKGVNIEEECPGDFICPLSKSVMVDPAVASDGYSYEKSWILASLMQRHVSPMTNESLDVCNGATVMPNRVLRAQIYEWVESRLKEFQEPADPYSHIPHLIGKRVEALVREEMDTMRARRASVEDSFNGEQFSFQVAQKVIKRIINNHLGKDKHQYAANPSSFSMKVHGKISISEGLKQGQYQDPKTVSGRTVCSFLASRPDTASIPPDIIITELRRATHGVP